MRRAFFLLIFIVATFLPVAAFAQNPKGVHHESSIFKSGTMFAGGSVTYAFDRMEEEDVDDAEVTHTVSINPTVGYFITKNLALYGALLLNREMGKQGDIESTYSMYGLGLGIGLFLPLRVEKLVLYIAGQFSYGLIEGEINYTDIPILGDLKKEVDGHAVGVTGRIGLLYMVRPSLGLELGLQVDWHETELNDEDPVLINLNTEESGVTIAMGYLGVKVFF